MSIAYPTTNEILDREIDREAIDRADELLDAEKGNRLWKVIRALARNRGCRVEDIPNSDWARVKWLMECNARIEAMSDEEFADLVNEADDHIELERYQEARDAYMEYLHE